MPRLLPVDSLGTPEILSTGATLHLGLIHLHVENRECRSFKSSARCQKFGVPCRFFRACKWGLRQLGQPRQPGHPQLGRLLYQVHQQRCGGSSKVVRLHLWCVLPFDPQSEGVRKAIKILLVRLQHWTETLVTRSLWSIETFCHVINWMAVYHKTKCLNPSLDKDSLMESKAWV